MNVMYYGGVRRPAGCCYITRLGELQQKVLPSYYTVFIVPDSGNTISLRCENLRKLPKLRGAGMFSQFCPVSVCNLDRPRTI